MASGEEGAAPVEVTAMMMADAPGDDNKRSTFSHRVHGGKEKPPGRVRSRGRGVWNR
jgi:hypothetical protein